MTVLALLLVPLFAQAPSGSCFSVGVERTSESLKYHFDNPSRLDTPDTVPHFFEQTYDTDALWIVARASVRLFAMRVTSDAAFAPSRTRGADDFDTFFQPDGNVVVTGTTGNASLFSWRVNERVEVGRWRNVRYGVGYWYRRDRARFHEGEGVTTTTIPASVTHRAVTTRETAVSNVHAVPWLVEGTTRIGARGVLESRAQFSAVALARLTVDLPDKYPGRVLVFDAKVALIDAQSAYWYSRGAWAIGVGGGVRRSFNWRRDARLDLRGAFGIMEISRRIP